MAAIAWAQNTMLAFLALLPRVLVTFFYALAALLRFFVDGTVDSPATPPGQTSAATLLGWSLAAFYLASAALLVDLGIEWNRGSRRRDRLAERTERQGVRQDREDQYRKALAQFLLEPSNASRERLRDLMEDWA